ncbi:HvfC/BufC family peptide modification chaperone [Spongiibacter tropicus]|uniref:HvfC/BufC family peptide modification chaperone n=1 Tax=Spongiibacter tropicus TaxID=454602 RepID=UPI0024E26145|nr:putative DNA-binding domain-containing protein [Spongiibacter tropicus]
MSTVAMSSPAPKDDALSSQQRLLHALRDHRDETMNGASGLVVYRRNMAANAARVLGISFPTLRGLVGEPALPALAMGYLRAHGREVFDWGQWGEALASWLAEQPVARQYPYLADCARLDWLIHLAERSAPQAFMADAFAVPAGGSLLRLAPDFAAGAACLDSAFPIVSICRAHRQNPTAPDLSIARHRLLHGEGESALVWQRGGMAVLRAVEPPERVWLRFLDSPQVSIGDTLDWQRAGDAPFEQWLDHSIREQLIVGLRSPTITE